MAQGNTTNGQEITKEAGPEKKTHKATRTRSSSKRGRSKGSKEVFYNVPTWHKGPDTPGYRKLKYTYWMLLGSGAGLFIFAFIIGAVFSHWLDGMGEYYVLAMAIAPIVFAYLLDTFSVKKIQNAHQLALVGKHGMGQQKKPRK